MQVLKFGGTSMGSVESLKSVVNIIQTNFKNKTPQVITCSAMGGITDQLLNIGKLAESHNTEEALGLVYAIQNRHFETAKALNVEASFKENARELFTDLDNLVRGIGMIHEFSQRSLAYLLSFGEKLSTRLLVEVLKHKKVKAQQFDSSFIKTKDAEYWAAEVDWEKTYQQTQAALNPILESGIVPVVTGFFGTNEQGIIALLGRGGSDFSGAILAVSLGISKLEIWTDVDGFMSADPRIVDTAKVIDEISFPEASELCFFGAKVLHPRTIRPVIEKGGEVFIKNTFNPKVPGTKITRKARETRDYVLSISSKKVAILSFDVLGSPMRKHELFAELFRVAKEKCVFVDMIASSEVMISFCVEIKDLEKNGFLEAVKDISPLEVLEDREIICIVSPENVQGKFGVAAEIFQAIAESKVSVEMYSQNASEIAQLIVVKSENAKEAVKSIHEILIS